MRTHRLPLAIAVLVLVAACGGADSSDGDDGSTTPSVTVEPSTSTPSTAADRPVIGQLTATPEVRSFVNEIEVSSAQRLRAGDRLRTDGGGLLVFELDEKISECRALPDSRLQLRPSAEVLVKWEEGVGVCVTNNDPGTVAFGAGAAFRLAAADPVFTVTVDGDTTRVDVDRGFVTIEEWADRGSRQLVGPERGVTVGAGRAPKRTRLAAPATPTEEVARKRALSLYEPAGLGRPSSTGSETLDEAFEEGVLRVGVEIPAGDTGDRFARTLAGRLERAWDLVVDVDDLDGKSAATSLAEGAVHLVVTDEKPSGEHPAFVLVRPRGHATLWVLTREEDPIQLALKRFVAGAAANLDYQAAYRDAYKDDPNDSVYDALLPVLQDAGLVPR